MLDSGNSNQSFPDVEKSLDDPNGLLAIGGCLSTERLVNAYQHGIFPWFNEGDPILWWSPNPRLVLKPQDLRISRSLKKILRRQEFLITFDNAFLETLHACSSPRENGTGTWITDSMINAYATLHDKGIAHSVEAWYDGKLCGGLYGVALGRVFFGESMFFTRSNASKAAFATLSKYLQIWNYSLIDCQVKTKHLVSLGAIEIKRKEFINQLAIYCKQPVSLLAWKNTIAWDWREIGIT